MIMRCNADIPLVEARCERVLHLANGAAGAVYGHHLHDEIRKLPLLPNGKLLLHERIVNLPAALFDGMDHWHELRTHIRLSLIHILLKTISGLMHPKSGSISFLGDPIAHTEAYKLVNRGLAPVSYTHLDVYKRQGIDPHDGPCRVRRMH